MAGRLLRTEKWTEVPPNTSGLGEVPHHWLGHWEQRGSAVGMERTLVFQGGRFRDFQGKFGVGLERARTQSWAMITWLPLNFISHLPFYSKMLLKDIFGGCAPHPKAWPSVAPAASSSKGRVARVSSLWCVSNSRWAKWTGPSCLSLTQLRKGLNQPGLCQRSNRSWAMIILPSYLNIDIQNLLNRAIELLSMLISQTQEILSSSFCPSTYFFCFPLSVSLMLLQNMWEPFFSYFLPPCNLHFSSIVPTNRFWNDLFLLTFCSFLRRKLIGRFPKPHLFKSQILVTMGAASISLMKW